MLKSQSVWDTLHYPHSQNSICIFKHKIYCFEHFELAVLGGGGKNSELPFFSCSVVVDFQRKWTLSIPKPLHCLGFFKNSKNARRTILSCFSKFTLLLGCWCFWFLVALFPNYSSIINEHLEKSFHPYSIFVLYFWIILWQTYAV